MGRAALVAEAALLDGSTDPFYRAKLAAADYALRHWLPVGRAQRAVIEAGVDGLTHYVPDIDCPPFVALCGSSGGPPKGMIAAQPSVR